MRLFLLTHGILHGDRSKQSKLSREADALILVEDRDLDFSDSYSTNQLISDCGIRGFVHASKG